MDKLYCTHRQFNPANLALETVSKEDYQKERSHPEKPEKNSRENSQMCRVRIAEGQLAQDRGMRQFLLNEADRVKVVGFKRGVDHPVSTGTSKVGRLCVTDGMSFCVAVAIGGEKINSATGQAEVGAKVRIFHVYPQNKDFSEDIEAYVGKLKREGLTPKVAIHGEEYSNSLSEKVRGVFKKLDLKIELDKAGAKIDGTNTPLGVVVREDNRVHFVTELLTGIQR